MIKAFSGFTGIGGFEKAAQEAGLDVEWVGHSEIDKHAEAIFSYHFSTKNYGDITKLATRDVPGFDFLVGGFPCQAFSHVGKRGGFQDTRGTLFFELARFLRDKRPRHFIFENVGGLLTHDEGRTFRTIIQTIDELGYWYEWQAINSKDYGVPQNRPRVYIVGHLGTKPTGKIFPIGTPSAAFEKPSGLIRPLRWHRTELGKEVRREGMKNGRDYTPFNKGHRELVIAPEATIGCITSALAKDSLVML